MSKACCGHHTGHTSETSSAPGSEVPSPVEFIDPICGMRVKPDSPHRLLHAGVEYRFCCVGCLERFQRDPAAALANTPPTPAVRENIPAMEGVDYTCPMHPEIVNPGPGDCPLCGMSLEPMMPGLEDPAAEAELNDMRRRYWVTFRRAPGSSCCWRYPSWVGQANRSGFGARNRCACARPTCGP